MISFEDIKMGYRNGYIWLIDSPNGDGTACQIGLRWFYFGDEKTEKINAREYAEKYSEDSILHDIKKVLDEFIQEMPDYYAYFEDTLHYFKTQYVDSCTGRVEGT